MNKSLELIIFIGLQASGKSTFYRKHFSTHHQLISKDLLRNNKRPQRRQIQLLKEALQNKQDIVIDNTNPSVKDRAPLIALGKEHDASIIGYYFQSIISDCRSRNDKREGRAQVPNVALYTTIKNLERPVFEEGFDRLYFVQMGEIVGDFEIKSWNEDAF